MAILIVIHLLSFALLVGGVAFEVGPLLYFRHATSLKEVQMAAFVTQWAERGIIPGVVGLLVTGIWMVQLSHGEWSLTSPWVIVALAALLLLAFLGGAFLKPRLREIRESADAAVLSRRDSDIDGLLLKAHNWLLHAVVWVMTGSLVGILRLMTARPGWGGSLWAMALGLGLGILLALVANLLAPNKRQISFV